jgi:hypothetical protein
MSELIVLRLYYEPSLLEGNDRILVAKCNFIVGELLKVCWKWDTRKCRPLVRDGLLTNDKPSCI